MSFLRPSRAVGRVFVLLAAAALLAACRVDTTVEVSVRDNGSGQVRVSAAFDDQALGRVGDLRLDDVRAAGWTVTGPQKEPDRDATGRTWVHAAKNFSTSEQFSAIMTEISGPNGIFRDFELRRSTGFGKVTYSVTGRIEPPPSLDAFSDAEIAQLLGGNPLGRPTAEVANEAGNLSMVLGIVLPDDLGGDTDRSSGRRGEWDIAVGGAPTVIAVHSTDARGARLWAAGAAVLALGAVVSLLLALSRRSRPSRRPRRERVPAGLALTPAAARPAASQPPAAPTAAPRHVIPTDAGDAPVAPVAPVAASRVRPSTNQRRINVVVLDVMGVLFREADDVAALLVPFVREHGGTDDVLAIRARYVDASVGRHTTRELWSLLGVPGDAAALDAAYVERLELNEGVYELLDAMDQRGIAVAALTNDVSEWSLSARRRFGLAERIAPWVVSGDVGVRKPDARIFTELARTLGRPLHECLFVDDRRDNLAAGRAQGMAVVQFAPEPIEGSPYRRIGSLFELFNRGRVST